MDDWQKEVYKSAVEVDGMSHEEAVAFVAVHMPTPLSPPVSSVSLNRSTPLTNDTTTHTTQGDTPPSRSNQPTTISDRPSILNGLSFDEMEWRVRHKKPLTWTVPGMVPDGLSLLAGPSKAGKSFMCLDIALAVAAGSTALDHIVCEQGDVLYLAGEDTERRIIERIQMRLSHPDLYPRDHLTVVAQEHAAERGADALAKAWVEYVDNPRLLIIDTKARLLDGRRNQRDAGYQSDYNGLTPIHDFAVRNDFSLLVVTHTNQARQEDGDDWFNKIQGTTGIVGVADGAILLDVKRGAKEGVLRVAGRDMEETEVGLYRAGPWWGVMEGGARNGQGDRTIQIREFVLSQELPVTPAQVAEKLDVSMQTARTYLTRLKERGQIATYGRGLYGKPS